MFSVLPEGANRIRFNVTDLGWNNSLSFMIDYMETEKISGNENAEIVVEAEEWLSASHTPSVYKSSVSSGEKKIQLAPSYPAEIELEKVTKSFEISGDMIKFILLPDEEKLMPAIGAVFAKGANAVQRPVTFWGDSITAGAGDRIITNAAEKRNSDMLVICMGTNGGRCQGYTINFFNFVHFV